MSEKALKQQQENTKQEHVNEEPAIIENQSNDEITDLPPEIVQTLEDMGLDDSQKVKLVQAISMTEQYKGPIPHPRIIKGYEDILPGAADRILSMAEEEAKHRHSIDNKCVKTDSRDSLLGIVFAFVLAMVCVIGGIIVIIKAPETLGTIMGFLITGTGLGGILTTFVRGTKATWKLNHDKK